MVQGVYLQWSLVCPVEKRFGKLILLKQLDQKDEEYEIKLID